MDSEKERLIQRYKDEHRRLVDREREFEDLRANGKIVDEKYAVTKRKTEAFQSVGYSVGDVVCVLNDEEVLVKSSLGSRYVVNTKKSVDIHKLEQGRAWRWTQRQR